MSLKSRATLLRALYSGILIDAGYTFPESKSDFRRDNTRVDSLLERGDIGFFTIVLPSWSKLVTMGLEQGSIRPFLGPHSRPRRGEVFPKLFSGLFAKIFSQAGLLREDADHKAILLLQTLLNAAKKLRMPCDDSVVVETIRSFVETEASVRPFTLNWGDAILDSNRGLSIVGDDTKPSKLEARDMFNEFVPVDKPVLPSFGAIQSTADWVALSLGSPFQETLEPHHGPGAISDRGDNPSKYQFRNWPEKLEHCFPYSAFGVPNARYWLQPLDEADPLNRFNPEKVPSRLIAVPKTQKGPRLIAAEPVANMWMQQALRRFLEDRVAKTALGNSISFRDQTPSGTLALKASLDRKHATIDLSDASDRLSCWLIERFFRLNHDLLLAFNAVRTDCLHIERDAKVLPVPKGTPEFLMLKKFSTQGSALTFPVQTIVYTIIAIGVFLYVKDLEATGKNIEWASKQVRVFGDDIIVPEDIGIQVIEALTGLGFKVNANKTFSKGNFRESCGVDGYKGSNVTPTYVLEPYDPARPTSVASVIECVNNLYMRGFWHASRNVLETLPERIRKYIPFKGQSSGAFGIIDWNFRELNCDLPRFRVNPKTFQAETLALAVTAKVQKVEARGDFALHQYFTEKPDPMSNWENGEARRPKVAIRLRWTPLETME